MAKDLYIGREVYDLADMNGNLLFPFFDPADATDPHKEATLATLASFLSNIPASYVSGAVLTNNGTTTSWSVSLAVSANQVLFISGSAATPGLSFISDTDSGLYYINATSWGATVAGANVATFFNDGTNKGIQTFSLHISGPTKENTSSLTSTANAVAWDLASGTRIKKLTLSENSTVSLPTNLTYIGEYILDVTNTGSFTLAYNAIFLFPGGTAPTLTTSGRDVYRFYCDGTNMIYIGGEQDLQ